MTQKRTPEDSLQDLIGVLISEMRSGQAAMNEGFNKLAEAQARTEASIDRLTAGQEKLDGSIDRLTARIDVLSQNVAAQQVITAQQTENITELIRLSQQQQATVDKLLTKN